MKNKSLLDYINPNLYEKALMQLDNHDIEYELACPYCNRIIGKGTVKTYKRYVDRHICTDKILIKQNEQLLAVQRLILQALTPDIIKSIDDEKNIVEKVEKLLCMYKQDGHLFERLEGIKAKCKVCGNIINKEVLKGTCGDCLELRINMKDKTIIDKLKQYFKGELW